MTRKYKKRIYKRRCTKKLKGGVWYRGQSGFQSPEQIQQEKQEKQEKHDEQVMKLYEELEEANVELIKKQNEEANATLPTSWEQARKARQKAEAYVDIAEEAVKREVRRWGAPPLR